MSAAFLTHVIPPVRGGVWDFTHAVAARLGIENRVLPLAAGDAGALRECDGGDLLLHYSGYGFAKRGAPIWLVRSMLARRHRLHSLGVFFHELYATGPPWSSAFWLSPAQRYIASGLVEMADFWLTTCESYRTWLERYTHGRPHAVLPIASNVGELEANSATRRSRVVVFGGSRLRESVYETAGEQLFAWARGHGLEIHDVGAKLATSRLLQWLQAGGAVEHGHLEPAQVSAILAASAYGVVKHKSVQLAKSGVFAAYCAHGVCPIVFSREYCAADGLQPGLHYLPGLPPHDRSIQHPARIGDAAWRWYGDHRLERHSEAIRHLIRVP